MSWAMNPNRLFLVGLPSQQHIDYKIVKKRVQSNFTAKQGALHHLYNDFSSSTILSFPHLANIILALFNNKVKRF
jgi:hypothetical protein